MQNMIQSQNNNPKVKKEVNVSIIVLNWNGWEDTVQCLQSLLDLRYDNFSIVVVDNGSDDQSVDQLENWIEKLNVSSDKFLTKNNYENIYFLKNKDNLGYAGGNNVGIKFALTELRADAIWVLNNDTLVDRDSLSYLVEKVCSGYDVAGSQIRFISSPDLIWCEAGGSYSSWTMLSRNQSINKKISEVGHGPSYESIIEGQIDYIAGASILFTRSALEKVGLFCEDYFLYLEEPDWFNRAKNYNITAGYSSRSIVYHAIGKSTDKYNLTLGKFYAFRGLIFKNNILFALKFHPLNLVTILLACFAREIVHGVKFIIKNIRKLLLALIPKKFNLPIRWYKLRAKNQLDPELYWLQNYFKKSGKTAIDVGANLGFYCYGLEKCFITIHAFEPIKKLTHFLEDYESKKIQIHSVACSDAEGVDVIHIPSFNNEKDFAYAGLDVDDRYTDYETIEIFKRTIDSYSFKDIDLIKIDVEGHELSVARGACKTIEMNKPILVVELEDRHRTHAVSSFYEYVASLADYKGFYLSDQKLIPIEKFNVGRDQKIDSDGNPLSPYINNFIFISSSNNLLHAA